MADRLAESSSGEVVYDGFISYSHAADGLLAPRLQAGLQRFAKPWWKRRAVRIFRDESSLSANPHLWSSITEALDSSGWFVLLLSPDAAESEWVNQEITYWVEHRDPKRILPVVTDGSFSWADGDVTGDAVPDALRDVFAEEPRWVDLRFARVEEELDLKHPTFNSAIADIASTIRGVPKDELASEEVRQHRRTVRTAWAAGMALLALAVAATGAAAFAFAQQAEASRQRDLAVANEERALSSEQLAIENEQRARENEQRALESEAEVRRESATREALRLSTIAKLEVDRQPERAILLLLHALAVAPPQTIQADLKADLRDAMLANPVLETFEVSRGRNSVALSPDGRTIYHASPSDGSVRAIDVDSGVVEWENEIQPGGFPGDDLLGPPRFQIDISADGTSLSVVVAPGDAPVQVVVLDNSGNTELEFSPGDCPVAWLQGDGFSPDGQYFSIATGSDECGSRQSPDEDWAVWYDTETWELVGRLLAAEAVNERVLFSLRSEQAVIAFQELNRSEVIEIRDGATDELVGTFGGGMPVLSPVGGSLLYDPEGARGSYDFGIYGRSLDSLTHVDLLTLVEARTDMPRREASRDVEVAQGSISWYRFAGNGTRSAVLFARSAVVMSSEADYLTELRYEQDAYDLAWSTDGSRLVTSHEEVLIVWAIDPDRDRTAEINRADDWPSLAVELLGRSFTDAECLQFGIAPCPTLEDLSSPSG